MTRRNLAAAIFAIAAALICVRLGLWQLERHEVRRDYNAHVAERREAAPVPIHSLQAHDGVRYRRVEARGVFDYEHEIALANRTRRGSPGVYLLTPLRLEGEGEGRTVLVNRGWIYAPDGVRANRVAWRESDTVHVEGYLEQVDTGEGAGLELRPGIWQRLDSAALERAIPYPVEQLHVVASSITPEGAQAPARLGLPPLEHGPHLSYAFQWFAFGTIAVVGVGALIRQDVRRRRRFPHRATRHDPH
jgi:surfeit locus 1 family protein